MNTLVDNFEAIKRLMDNCSLDDFYYVAILKRLKDNDYIATDQRLFMNRIILKHFKVRTHKELLEAKEEIKKICDENNARAYITLYKCSERKTEKESIVNKKFTENKEDNLYISCTPKTDDWITGNLMTLLDIDFNENDIKNGYNVWSEIKNELKQFRLNPVYEYKTPNGLHIILPNKNNTIYEFIDSCRKKFKSDNMFGIIKYPRMILYSNITKKH